MTGKRPAGDVLVFIQRPSGDLVRSHARDIRQRPGSAPGVPHTIKRGLEGAKKAASRIVGPHWLDFPAFCIMGA